MTRGRLSLAAVLLVAVGAFVVVRIARSEPSEPPAAAVPARLALVVVATDDGPLTTVVGAGGSSPPAALVLPARVAITIPGYGDGTVGEASELAGGTAATAASNLLGVWIPNHASIELADIGQLVDRAGGIEMGGVAMSGADVGEQLDAAGDARETAWEATFEAILRTVEWTPQDVAEADEPTRVAELLNAARGAAVEVLPAEEVPGGLLRTEPGTVAQVVAAAWGFTGREVLPVVVLNGNGRPGMGELVAERVIPGGFRVVVSENASSFDHDTTLIVVPGEEHRDLAERVRDLLGVGEVQVAGPASGLADVTVVVGKDFGA